MKPNEFSFSWFARHSFNQSVNARLLELAEITPGQRIVELACGTGAVTRLIVERLRGARESALISIDHSLSALKEAMEQVQNVRETVVQFLQGQIESLSDMVKEHADTIVFCNGIHYITDKDQLLAHASAILKPQGVFAFNTSFFQGAHLPETEHFYRRWMYRAVRILKAKHDLLPTPSKVESRRQLTPEQYGDLLQRNGFGIKKQEIQTVPMTLQAWLDISRFEDFIQGSMPGVPLEPASEALQEGVTQTFHDLNLQITPRNWLEIVAVRS